MPDTRNANVYIVSTGDTFALRFPIRLPISTVHVIVRTHHPVNVSLKQYRIKPHKITFTARHRNRKIH